MTQQAAATCPPPDFNPLSPGFIRDPYPFYHHLREADPLHPSSLGMILASRRADVTQVLRDPRFGKDFASRMECRRGPHILAEPVYASMRRWMLQQGPRGLQRLPTHW